MKLPIQTRLKEMRRGDIVLSCQHVNADNSLDDELRTKFFIGGAVITFADNDGEKKKSHIQALCWPCALEWMEHYKGLAKDEGVVAGIDKFLANSFVWPGDPNGELNSKIDVRKKETN